MADPIKKNAQDYTRRDANNESDEYHHTCSFGLFQKDFRRKRGAVEECHEFGLGPVTSVGLALPFKPSREVADLYGVLNRQARYGYPDCR